LSDESARIWAEVHRESELAGPDQLILLRVALQALDRLHDAQQVLQEQGLTVRNERTGVVHIHPAALIEKSARQAFLSAWHALGLAQPKDPWADLPGT
jgi:phage terminase small subunit